jgi:hypothetical protein
MEPTIAADCSSSAALGSLSRPSHLKLDLVVAFHDHLQSARGNTARTRNVRPAAVRAFVQFVLGEADGVNFIGVGHRILAIPQKKFFPPGRPPEKRG